MNRFVIKGNVDILQSQAFNEEIFTAESILLNSTKISVNRFVTITNADILQREAFTEEIFAAEYYGIADSSNGSLYSRLMRSLATIET